MRPTYGLNSRARAFARLWAWLVVALLVTLGAACAPIAGTPPPPSNTPTATITLTPAHTPTPTIVWFPSTEPPTPFPTPTIQPTLDPRAGVGPIIFADDFSSGAGWPLQTSSRGNIAYGPSELTIALSAPRTYLSSVLPQPNFNDFYLEITASASLCAGEDKYGLIIRQASPGDFYRFSLSCDGHLRIDRVYRGVLSLAQPRTYSGAVPSAAPGAARLGVWAVHKEIRFFVNGHYQFTISDPIILSGNVGVFAHSAGDNAVTVNFSDLVVWGMER